MLVLTKPILKAIQTADRLVAFKEGSRHYLRVYPIRDNWNVTTDIDVPGSRVVGSVFRNTNHSSHPERGSCSACLSYSAGDVFRLLKVGDAIALEWWPDCNSPWLDSRGLTRDLLRLLVDRKEGKGTRRLEIHLDDSITDADSNHLTRLCRGFPKPEPRTDAA